MGNDVSLVATDVAEEYPPRLANHSWIGDVTEHTPLFWLCCFRLTDFKEVRKGGNPCRYLCCPYDQAMSQFSEGLEILKKFFPETFVDSTEIARLKESFVELLERCRKKFLMLEIWQCDDRPQFEVVLQHCLAGFWHPYCRYYYCPKDLDSWNKNFLPPHDSGVMDWAGALRRMITTGQHQLVESRALFDSSSGDLLPALYDEAFLTGFHDLSWNE